METNYNHMHEKSEKPSYDSYRTETEERPQNEIEREITLLRESVNYLYETCSRLDGCFSSVLRPSTPVAVNGGPTKESSPSTKLGAMIAELRGKVQSANSMVGDVLDRREV